MRKAFQQVLDQAFTLKERYLSNPKTPDQLKKDVDLKLRDKPFDKDLSALIQSIFDNSINTQNPRFLNQLYGGSTEEAWLGELMTSVLNTSMATYEIAPLATLMEKEVLSAINEQVGFKDYEGLMTPGGSYANMLGINCARYAKDADLKMSGMPSNNYKIFVSKDAHYSSEKALGLMGLGMDALIKVETDDQKRICVKDLEAKIKESLSKNEIPFCVVSTAATTVWGAFDPIESIQNLCTQYKLWHHVDAAWGGLALWSEQQESLFKGIESVDSITLDFHKLMASTLTKGLFLTSNPEALKGANSGGGTKYIFHNAGDERASLDTGTYALQCGRKVNSLPLWFQWKLGGTAQFKDKVSELYSTAGFCVDFIKGSPEQYKLLLKPEFMNICFQVLPSNPKDDVGKFNREMRERLMKRGKFMVNFSSTPEDGAFFRLVLSHWGVTKDILKELFVELQEIKKEMESL